MDGFHNLKCVLTQQQTRCKWTFTYTKSNTLDNILCFMVSVSYKLSSVVAALGVCWECTFFPVWVWIRSETKELGRWGEVSFTSDEADVRGGSCGHYWQSPQIACGWGPVWLWQPSVAVTRRAHYRQLWILKANPQLLRHKSSRGYQHTQISCCCWNHFRAKEDTLETVLRLTRSQHQKTVLF